MLARAKKAKNLIRYHWLKTAEGRVVRMRKLGLYFFLIPVAMAVSLPAPARETPRLEKIEWSEIWVDDANQSELPRVLMVGDSIAQGYFRDVEKDLAGKASCAKFATSMFMSNPDYLDTLKIILRRYRFSVIHINNGLHGWTGYTEEQYRLSLPKLMETLTKYDKGARIIWATTTPRRNPQYPSQRAADNDRVLERNRIAVEYMHQHRVAVDDLYGLVADHPEYYNLPQDATHFNAQGRALEARQVSDMLLHNLAGKSDAAAGQ
jgi:hypothetical protein